MRDKGELVAVMSMDLSKVFDVLPHSLFLAKLKAQYYIFLLYFTVFYILLM